MYRADGFFKVSEEDIYEEGCIPNSGSCFSSHEVFRSHSLDSLLDTIAKYVGADRKDIEVNACDEPGRVDICIMENDDGYPATEKQIELWKEGKTRLWDSIYSFKVYEYEAKPVNFEEKTNG